jgi:electron transfer flavoprotein beta subunit
MKIVVLVKHAQPDSVDDQFSAAGLTGNRSAPPGPLDEADERAVEQARRIACRRRDVQISALTMGPPEAAATLRRALVLGADEGVHVLDDTPHRSDATATSRILAAAVRRLGFDLVLCGAAAADTGTGVLPTMVADLLGVPSLCSADAVDFINTADFTSPVDFSDTADLAGTADFSGAADFAGAVGLGGLDLATVDEIVIRRDCGDSVDEIAAVLPALVSVTERCAAPHYPTVRAVIEARQKLVRTWTPRDLGITATHLGPRTAVTVTRRTTPREVLPGGVILDDEHGSAATGLADFLAARHLI